MGKQLPNHRHEIPYHVPDIGEEEIRAVAAAMSAGHLVGGGPISRRVEARLCQMFGCRYALLTTSCTHAMELALMALDVGPGDEVICPSFTFSSTANAIVVRGATPVFADVEESTLNISVEDVARKITPRTRVIMPVHYAGVACPMDELRALAAEHDLAIVEDAAPAPGAKYKGKYLGTCGDAGCFSFHGTKNITCGEGGALLTDRDDLAQRAEIIREKGTNRQAFLRGEVDKYTWVDIGSSYVLSDLQAAMLEVQLDKLTVINAARGERFRYYMTSLADLEAKGLLRLPRIPDYAEPNYHVFYILLPSEAERNRVMEVLREQGIKAVFHYVPLHSSPYGKRMFGYSEMDLPVTEAVSARLLRLPLYASLSKSDQERVIEALYRALSSSC